MIKVKKTREKEEELNFPCLVTNPNDGDLIIFAGKVKGDCFQGIVLEPGNSSYSTGYCTSSWIVDSFVKYKGTLEISNR